MQVERYTSGDKVAVLYSPGYGGGWSSWADDKYQEFTLFDKRLVEKAIEGVDEVEVKKFIESILPDSYIYCGGWKDITVAWVVKGTEVIIDEYDGSESIQTTAIRGVVA